MEMRIQWKNDIHGCKRTFYDYQARHVTNGT